jgi:hypothetical protein
MQIDLVESLASSAPTASATATHRPGASVAHRGRSPCRHRSPHALEAGGRRRPPEQRVRDRGPPASVPARGACAAGAQPTSVTVGSAGASIRRRARRRFALWLTAATRREHEHGPLTVLDPSARDRGFVGAVVAWHLSSPTEQHAVEARPPRRTGDLDDRARPASLSIATSSVDAHAIVRHFVASR